MVYQSGTSDVLVYKRSRHVSPEEQAQNDLNAQVAMEYALKRQRLN
jgi:hypothetical protein